MIKLTNNCRVFILLILLYSTIVYFITPDDVKAQATWVHRIKLLDEEGNAIEPESSAPYSPKQTCGRARCHNYKRISKGYHFQTGIKEILGTGKPSKKCGRPWVLSDAATGTQIAMACYRGTKIENFQFAISNLQSPPYLLTPFIFAQNYAAYHPGGGMLEFDRDGNRYDEKMLKDNELADSDNPDYHGAKWDKSGVLEIDCLICHLRRNYDYEERCFQLKVQNFKWAATVAAGFGTSRGKVIDSSDIEEEDAENFEEPEEPTQELVKIVYNPWIFNSDGTVTIDIPTRPSNENCLFCHQVVRENSHNVSPLNFADRDVHIAAGMMCVDCHRCDIEHQIARGDGSDADARYNRNNAFLSCEGCHAVGRIGAPVTDHPGIPRLHLDKIACTTCHSGLRPTKEKSIFPVKATIGQFTASGGEESNHTTSVAYTPIYNMGKDGKIYPYSYVATRWWGNKSGGAIWPLFPSEVAPAFEEASDSIEDDDGDDVPEVNTDEEILAVFAALEKTLPGERFEKIKPVYATNGRIYEADSKGTLFSYKNKLARPICWRVGHNVRPAKLALGASSSGGCTDCHAYDSPFFFNSLRTTSKHEPAQIKDKPKQSEIQLTKPLREILDYPPSLVRLGAWREGTLKPLGPWLTPIAAFLCLLHYITFGPKRVHEDSPPNELKRFTIFERWIHFFQMVSFLALAITGLGFILTASPSASSSFWTSRFAGKVHTIGGVVFAAATLLLILRWAKAAIFEKHDLKWLLMFGGYLWKADPPASKFNAGQKLLFWFVAFTCVLLSVTGLTMAFHPIKQGVSLDVWFRLSYTLHDLAALLLMAGIVVHLYLGTIANPGTLRSIFEGKVSRSWAKKHHSIWYERQSKVE